MQGDAVRGENKVRAEEENRGHSTGRDRRMGLTVTLLRGGRVHDAFGWRVFACGSKENECYGGQAQRPGTLLQASVPHL